MKWFDYLMFAISIAAISICTYGNTYRIESLEKALLMEQAKNVELQQQVEQNKRLVSQNILLLGGWDD